MGKPEISDSVKAKIARLRKDGEKPKEVMATISREDGVHLALHHINYYQNWTPEKGSRRTAREKGEKKSKAKRTYKKREPAVDKAEFSETLSIKIGAKTPLGLEMLKKCAEEAVTNALESLMNEEFSAEILE